MDKTICELFAGVGGFRLGFEKQNKDWNTVWFSQWEPGKKKQWAHDCYVKHFGNSPDINGDYTTGIDISDVKKETIPDHSILVGGFPCLTGETQILTEDGFTCLKDIKVGNKVFTDNGTFEKVTNFFDQGVKKTYKLAGEGFDDIYATGNHRFFVNTGKEKRWLAVGEMKNLENPFYLGYKLNEKILSALDLKHIPSGVHPCIDLKAKNKEVANIIKFAIEYMTQTPYKITKTNGKFYCIPNNKTAFYEDGYIWYQVLSLEKDHLYQVYDIEVENSHTFIANNIISHNCQSYSVASTLKNSKGIEGEKGILWWQIRDILETKNPPFVLLENVDRLLKSPAKQRGRDFGIMLKCFDDLDYNVEWRVINAATYGGPQRRRRTFIFAYKRNTNWNTEKDILKEGFFAKTFPIEDEFNISTTELKGPIGDISDQFNFNFKKAGYMVDGKIFTSDVKEIEESPIKMRDIIEHNVDEHFYITDEKMPKWTYLKGSKKIPKVAKNGFEYIYSEGPVGFPDDLDKPGRTMLTSEGSVNRSSHAVEDPETGRIRIITPIEAERLQGFDDNWTEGMTERMRYFVMGNALVVPMITRMAKTLEKIIEKES